MNNFDNKRCLDMFYIFSNCIPLINSPEIKNLEKSLGMDITQLFKDMIIGLSVDMVQPENKQESYNALLWVRDACNYILDKSNDLPKTKIIKDGVNTRYTF